MMQDPKPERRTKEQLPKCKVNTCLRRGNFQNGICDKCTTVLNKVSKRNKPLRKQGKSSWSKAFRECKASFQKLRRLQEMDNNGVCKCVNGEYRHWNRCQGGHYIPAKNINTCFEPMNVHPQSGHKNRDMDNPIVNNEYREYMVNRYGLEAVQDLEIRSKQSKHYSAIELIEMKKDYDKQIFDIMKMIK